MRDVLVNGKQWLVDLEQRERERTGIRTLKVSYNKVFGYYIDVTRSKSGDVPEEYVRKQTLANSERFITPELKELENRVLGADAIGAFPRHIGPGDNQKPFLVRMKMHIVWNEPAILLQLRNTVGTHVARILHTAHSIAQIDCLFSLGQAAVYHNFCKPVISEDGQYILKDCRLPPRPG